MKTAAPSSQTQGDLSACLSRLALEHCSQSVMITDAQGFILEVNTAFCRTTGYSPNEVKGQTPRILKSGRHDDVFYSNLWYALRNAGRWSGEIWDKRKDGSLFLKWVTIDALYEDGKISHYVAISHDITHSKEHENLIRYQAEHDSLTGLPNRRLLQQHGQQLIHSNRDQDHAFAVLLIDLDRFKNINDALGHQAGDEVLMTTAKKLSESVRTTDTVARLGGDEFVVLLTQQCKPQIISEIVTTLHRKLSEPMTIRGRTVQAPPSIGIALHPQDGENMETLLHHADVAMYRTKAHGRSGWTFYTPAIQTQVTERLALEEALLHALEAEALDVHYQPLIETHTGQILSWEALLRWNHPTLGSISPERIIPIAEETGLIHRLGCWVIDTACRQLRQWNSRGQGPYRISVNVSPSQLEHPGLKDHILSAISHHGIEPRQLEIEITENVLISDSEQATSTLQALRQAGLLVTLDDFGTGYSSLNYLRTLSVDRVKIDRSFVAQIAERKEDAAIVQAVITLAKSLSLGVVAEGVERHEQQTLLASCGCNELQGFLLGKPMPTTLIPSFLDGSKVEYSPS